MGGSPLFSIERGRGNLEKARVIMGNTFALLVGTGVVLTAVILLIKQPLLYAFGASDATYQMCIRDSMDSWGSPISTVGRATWEPDRLPKVPPPGILELL